MKRASIAAAVAPVVVAALAAALLAWHRRRTRHRRGRRRQRTIRCPCPYPSHVSLATLRLLHVNAWSGSTYELHASSPPSLLERLTGTGARVGFYREAQREARFAVLVAEILRLQPNVVTLNEVMPSPDFAERLADATGLDVVCRTALAGLRALSWSFPALSEGDAILAHPDLGLCFGGRARLSGSVFSEFFSLNTADASQALCGVVHLESAGRRVPVPVVCTHWHAGLLGFPQLTAQPSLKAALRASTAARVSEARGTMALVQRLRGPVVVAGDLNTTLGSPEMQVLTLAEDPLECPAPKGPPTWDPEGNPHVRMQVGAGVEASSTRSAAENAAYAWQARQPCSLDHVLFRERQWTLLEHRVVLTGARCCSDHYGIFSRLELRPMHTSV